MDLLNLFVAYGPWSWLIIGLILLGLELLLPGGVFLWLGAAAIITALACFVFPLDWPRQVSVFGLLGIASIVFWLRLVRSRGNDTDRPLLNQRAERHVGEEVVLDEPITDGFGRVLQTRAQAEDTLFGDPHFGGGVIPAEDLAAEVPGPATTERPFVLLNMIATADGRATIEVTVTSEGQKVLGQCRAVVRC